MPESSQLNDVLEEKSLRPRPARLDEIQPRPEEFEHPTVEELFRIESESTLIARQRGVGAEQKPIPQDVPLAYRSDEPRLKGVGLSVAPVSTVLCYRTLYFEDPTRERMGWSAGVVEPLRSTVRFYFRWATLPKTLLETPPGCGQAVTVP